MPWRNRYKKIYSVYLEKGVPALPFNSKEFSVFGVRKDLKTLIAGEKQIQELGYLYPHSSPRFHLLPEKKKLKVVYKCNADGSRVYHASGIETENDIELLHYVDSDEFKTLINGRIPQSLKHDFIPFRFEY